VGSGLVPWKRVFHSRSDRTFPKMSWHLPSKGPCPSAPDTWVPPFPTVGKGNGSGRGLTKYARRVPALSASLAGALDQPPANFLIALRRGFYHAP